ncbi:MAG: biotin/lipoyl-binding protein, partial [Pseudomonadota bacterium]
MVISRSSTNRPVLASLFVVSLAVVSLLVTDATRSDAIAQGRGPVAVDVAVPLVRTVREWDEYTGRFEPVERVDVRARVSGYVRSIHFKDGQLVKRGDLLYIIDPRPFETELAATKARLSIAEARLKLASAQLKRIERLRRRDVSSEAQADERRAQRDVDAA